MKFKIAKLRFNETFSIAHLVKPIRSRVASIPNFQFFFLLLLLRGGFMNVSFGQTWNQLGPWGGPCYGIGGDSSMLLAKGEDQLYSKLYGSFDGGSTWKILKGNFDATGIVKIGKRIYGNDDLYAKVSVDSVNSWSANLGSSIGYMPVFGLDNGKVICSNNQVTTNDGINFTLVGNRIRIYNQFKIGNTIYAFKRQTDSLFNSSNEGSSWTFVSKIGLGFSYPLLEANEFYGFSPRAYILPGGAIYIRNNGTSNGPLLRSLDNGLTWQTCNTSLPNNFTVASYTAAVGSVLFTANASGGLYRSSDLGSNWEGINIPLPNSSITSLFGWKNRILVGSTLGIYYSDNLGEDWVEANKGFQPENSIMTYFNGSKISVATDGLVNKCYVSTNNGSVWKNYSVPFNLTNSRGFNFGDTCFFTDDNGYNYYASYNFGQDWSGNRPLSDPGFRSAYGIFGHNGILYMNRQYIQGNGASHLRRSKNKGITWDTAFSNHLSDLNSVSTFAGSGNKLYYWITPMQNSPKRFIRSINNGISWSPVTLPSSMNGITITNAVAKGDSIFVITSSLTSPAFRSFDGGQTWSQIFSLGGASSSNLYRLSQYKGALYLASGNGIYRSLNWGGSWINISLTLPFATSSQPYSYMTIKGDSLIVAPKSQGLLFTSLCSGTASSITLTPCSGGIIQLSANGGSTYSWSGPNSFTSSQQNPMLQNVNTSASGTYLVTINTLGGCSIQKSVTITVQPGAGNLTLSANTVCAGQTLNLDVTGGNGSYQWSGPRGFSSTLKNPSRDTLTAADSGFYSVKVTAANGCISTKSVYVVVPYLPRANQIPITNTNPCNKDTVLLQAAFKILGVGYQWFRNNVAIAGAGNSTYPATLSGKYHFVYTKGACRSLFADTVNITFSNLIQPRRPRLSVNPAPTACLQQFTINSTANGNYIRKWLKNGAEIPVANSSSYTTDQLATYQLQVDTGNTCISISAPFTVNLQGTQAFTSPQINVASIRSIPGDTLRCSVEWYRKDPPNANIQRVIILKQGSIANQYDSIGTVGNGINDTAFVDLNSNPQIQPYFYKIQARAICPSGGTYLTAPSPLHKTIHLQISKAPTGNIYNLLWTAYEGFTVSSYKIYRGLSASTTNFLLTTVAGNITAYTDAPPTNEIYFYRVEAVTTDVYFPWGRINATPPRVSKSNIKSITQRTQDSQSIYQDVLPAMENQVDNFAVYPNPHNQTFFIRGGKAGQKYQAVLRDMLGREISIWSFASSENLELQNQAPKGMYWLEIRGEGYKGGVRLVKE